MSIETKVQEFLKERNLGHPGVDMLQTLFDYAVELENRIDAANIGKPLEFPPLVTINGEAMDVESVISFPLEGETRNLFYNRRDPDVTRPVLVEVVSRE